MTIWCWNAESVTLRGINRVLNVLDQEVVGQKIDDIMLRNLRRGGRGGSMRVVGRSEGVRTVVRTQQAGEKSARHDGVFGMSERFRR
jgi:hypothetical protein